MNVAKTKLDDLRAENQKRSRQLTQCEECGHQSDKPSPAILLSPDLAAGRSWLCEQCIGKVEISCTQCDNIWSISGETLTFRCPECQTPSCDEVYVQRFETTLRTLSKLEGNAQRDGVAVGRNGSIELLEDRVRINREGFVAKFTFGLGGAGELDILLSQIIALEFSEPSPFAIGFLRIVTAGSQPTPRLQGRGGLLGFFPDANKAKASDESSVTFTADARNQFSKMRDAINSRLSTARQPKPMAPASNPLDDLAKLAGLRDEGIITDDEFEAKKRQLLGL